MVYDWERDGLVNAIEKSDVHDKDRDVTGHPRPNEQGLIDIIGTGASEGASASAGASQNASASASTGAEADARAAVEEVAATVAKRAEEWTREQTILFGKGNEKAFPDQPAGA